MDIWRWVGQRTSELRNDGHHRLAHIIDMMSNYTCNAQHDKVDAIFPEGLALARSIGDKWVELFIRHWHLQSQVLHRSNTRAMLPEAIDLLDFAHQEDTRDCPQRICTVQDLANCYGQSDGPGYFEERVQVARETLAEINPNWPCFSCVGCELIEAYMDVGQLDVALSELETLVREMTRHNYQLAHNIQTTKAELLVKLGRLDEAGSLLKKLPATTTNEEIVNNLLQALIHAQQGDAQKALKTCPSFTACLGASSYFLKWKDVQLHLANQDLISVDEPLLEQVHTMANTLRNEGSIRRAIIMFEALAQLAMRGSFMFTAQVAIDSYRDLIPSLRCDLGASEGLVALQQQLAQLRDEMPIARFDTPETLFEAEFDNANTCAEAYRHAHQQWPDHPAVTIRLAHYYRSFFMDGMASQLLREAWERNPDNEAFQYQYGIDLLRHQGPEAVFDRFPLNPDSEASLWLHYYAWRDSDPEQAYNHLLQLLERNSEDLDTLEEAARLAMELQAFDQSTHWRQQLARLEPDSPSRIWDILVSASIQGDWDLVRTCASQLDMELDPERPVNAQDWGSIRVRITEASGEENDYFARRTGPVTARIEDVLRKESPLHYHREVVFNPAPLNQLDQEDEDGHRCDSEGHYTYLFPEVHALKPSAFDLYDLDGVHPGEETLTALVEALEQQGVIFKQRSSEEYRLWDNDADEDSDLPAFYAFLLLPQHGDPIAVHETLQEFSTAQPHSWVWPDLLRTLNLNQLLTEQAATIERYGIE